MWPLIWVNKREIINAMLQLYIYIYIYVRNDSSKFGAKLFEMIAQKSINDFLKVPNIVGIKSKFNTIMNSKMFHSNRNIMNILNYH